MTEKEKIKEMQDDLRKARKYNRQSICISIVAITIGVLRIAWLIVKAIAQ